jgi:hypothetical protein
MVEASTGEDEQSATAGRWGVAAPWTAFWRPDPSTPLSPLQEALIGIAVTLHRGPSVARTREFPSRVARWLRSAHRGIHAADPVPADAVPQPSSARPPTSPALSSAPVSAASADASRIALAAPATAQRHEGAAASDAGAAHQLDSGPKPSTSPRASDTVATRPDTDTHSLRRRADPADRRPDDTNTLGPAGEPPLGPADDDFSLDLREAGVATALGGALYFINLLVHLDLPQCFESACRLASTVGTAGTLEALARALLPTLPPKLAEDPIWAVLARLDQRLPGEPPRAQGLRTDELRLPATWVEIPGGDACALRWGTLGNRLLVWSDAGYLLLDVPLHGDPVRQVRAELSRYAAAGLNRPAQQSNVRDCPYAALDHLRALRWRDGLLRWLEFAVPAIRHRLGRALGKATDEAWDPLQEIARCPGRVHLTDSLQSISTPLRLAGLDRSPGWVAGLGRVVLFHFQ